MFKTDQHLVFKAERSQTKRALFLDRDGVVNIDYGYVHRWETFLFQRGLITLLLRAKRLNYRLVLVTNQAGIAKRYYQSRDFYNLTKKMQVYLNQYKCSFDEIRFCPHHEKSSIPFYRKKCPYRKPGSNMITDSINDNGLDAESCFFIGDQLSDMQAAIGANLKKGCMMIDPKASAASVSYNKLKLNRLDQKHSSENVKMSFKTAISFFRVSEMI